MKKLSMLGIAALSILVLGACSSNDSGSKGSSTKESSSEVAKTEESSKTEASSTIESSTKTETSGDFVEKASDSYFDGTMLKGNSYSVKITDHKVIPVGEKGNEYGENPVLAFWFDTMVAPDYDNSTPINPNTAWIMNFEAVQDNDPNAVNKLDIASLPDEVHLDSQMAEIKPGGTVSSSVAYELTDLETPVKLTAKDILGTEYGSAEFPVK